MTSASKPILIGMNNPISTRPGHELYPAPDGCTGHRLWRMLHERTGALRKDYLDTFERRNLVRAVQFDRLTARARAHETITELRGSGRTVVLLGTAVQGAFDWAMKNGNKPWTLLDGLEGIPPLLVHPQVIGGVTWRQIPHPSGRNRFYNEPKNRDLVAMLLEELYVAYNGPNQREKSDD